MIDLLQTFNLSRFIQSVKCSMAFSYKDIISEAQSYFINGYMAILLFALFYDVFYFMEG